MTHSLAGIGSSSTSHDVRDLECRVVVLRNAASELLVVRRFPGVGLPTVCISPQQRVAESLTQRVLDQFGVAALCLFAVKSPTADSGSPLYEVMEARNRTDHEADKCEWIPVHQLSNRICDEEEIGAVSSAIREVQSYACGLAVGPFGKPGWLDELLGWVEREIARFGLRLSGDIRQFNASPTFALLRFETTGSAVWFKAVGEPNLHEVPIIAALSRRLPAFVPEVIAIHPSLNGWLTKELPGLTLSETSGPREWVRAAEALAECQVESRTQTRELLQSGCKDLTIPELLNRIDPFVETMTELMARQEKSVPAAMGSDEVRALGDHIRQAAAAWVQLGIPDTLGQLDLNPGNIVVARNKCAFLDWAEAYVGPPFVALDFLRTHLRRIQLENNGLDVRLVRQYGKKWGLLLPAGAFEKGQELACLLAPFAYAVGGALWHDARELSNTIVAGYFRSLTRRMQSESRRLIERGAICVR